MTDIQKEIARAIANSKNPSRTIELLYIKALSLKQARDAEQHSDRQHLNSQQLA